MTSKKLLLFAFKLAIVFAFASVETLPLAAQGGRGQLKGTYSFTGEQACLVSPLGFTNQVPNNPALASVQSASTQGIVKFNADGTGTADFKELLIAHPPAFAFAASQKASFSFNYTLADDGVLTFVFEPVNGTFLTGPLAGVTFTNTPPPMTGQVARNGTAITLTTVDPAVETATLGPPLSTSVQRICRRSRVLIPIHVDGND
jgi:hypothetical protein